MSTTLFSKILNWRVRLRPSSLSTSNRRWPVPDWSDTGCNGGPSLAVRMRFEYHAGVWWGFETVQFLQARLSVRYFAKYPNTRDTSKIHFSEHHYNFQHSYSKWPSEHYWVITWIQYDYNWIQRCVILELCISVIINAASSFRRLHGGFCVVSSKG